VHHHDGLRRAGAAVLGRLEEALRAVAPDVVPTAHPAPEADGA